MRALRGTRRHPWAQERTEQEAAMAREAKSPRELGSTGYEIFVGALSVLSIVNIVLITVMRNDALRNIVGVIDLLLSAIFLIDFLTRLHRAPSRADYFFRRYGWADLLASLPFPRLKILRIFRLIRVYRLLRQYGARNIVRSLIKDRAESALLTLLLLGILVLQFGSLAILYVEHTAPGANITNASDALWYCIATMSTVGYGDTYPVTNHGREIGTLVIVIGVGIFGTLTGYLANLFLAPTPVKTTHADPVNQLAELKVLMAQQQETVARLEAALDKS
jgi:voltage-gated potassium channel